MKIQAVFSAIFFLAISSNLFSGTLAQKHHGELKKIDTLKFVVENAVFLGPSLEKNKVPDGVGVVTQIIDGAKWFLLVQTTDSKLGPYTYDGENQYQWDMLSAGGSLLTISPKEDRSDYVTSMGFVMELFSGLGVWDSEGKVFHRIFNLKDLSSEGIFTSMLDLPSSIEGEILTKTAVKFHNVFLRSDVIQEIKTTWNTKGVFPKKMEAFSSTGNRAYTYEVVEYKKDLAISSDSQQDRPYKIILDVYDPTVEISKQVSIQRQILKLEGFLVNQRYTDEEFGADPAKADVIYDHDNEISITVPK